MHWIIQTGKLCFSLLLTICAIITQPLSSRADPSLVTDISSHLISVTSDFTGTELLLFGATPSFPNVAAKGHGDIIIIVRGPEENVVVRRKERVAGIWVNTDSIEFSKVPSFYAMVSTRPVTTVTNSDVLDRMKIGTTRLNIQATATSQEAASFREAIIRQKTEASLYSNEQTEVTFLGDTLFRTTIEFPANVPVGNYTAEFYLFENGDLISAQNSPLYIKKSGLGRNIFDFAQDYPALYGLAAILVALLAGWLASIVFRKD
jgi:uncharacterized protein (TIGR02186 family)